MSQKIDPREVLTYLNELGYTNITAQQLKDFISDLKKLIKYDRKHRINENIENIDIINEKVKTYSTPSSKIQSNQISPTCKCSEKRYCDNPSCPVNQANLSQNKEQDDVFSHLYSQHTVASRAKEIPKKDKHISVRIRKPKNKTYDHEHCLHVGKSSEYSDQENNIKLVENIETVSDGSKIYITTESTVENIHPPPNSRQSVTSRTSASKKRPKCSCTRSSSAKSINKSDPVALYHYYEAQWKKQKFPGQEHHSDLRWAVREKMLGGPKVELYPSSTSVRKKCKCWKG